MSKNSFTLRPLPFPLRVANSTANMFELFGIVPTFITPQKVIREAENRAGLPAKFPPTVLEALDVLCHSIVEARLHYFGRRNMWEMIVSGLEMRLRLDKEFSDNPELNQQKLIAPLIVTGLPRSGTTFLHRLLCETEDARHIPFYEGIHPVPRKPFDNRIRETHSKFRVWHWAGTPYKLDAMHYIRPELPDECNFPMRLNMRSPVFWSMAPVLSYGKWILADDMKETYEYYRKVLLFIQSMSPNQRLTLKCPFHLSRLDALLNAIPEAMVVQTHRDPLTSVASDMKLILSLHAISTDHLDCQKTIDMQVEKMAAYAFRSVELSKKPANDKIFHIAYNQVVSDPVDAVRSIRTHFGLDFTENHENRLSKYAQQNKQHKHGKNPYSLEWFNLDPKDITEKFSAYIDTFLTP